MGGPVRLHAVTMAAASNGSERPNATRIAFRELRAIVGSAPPGDGATGDDALDWHHRIVTEAFRAGPVLPLRAGMVFRSAEYVRQWLEMNHVPLAEGLHFVAGRCEARIHITAAPGASGAALEALATSATECLRVLRRSAAAAVSLRPTTGETLRSAAFLVARVRWAAFTHRVAEERRHRTGLAIEQTGPWPPYDFVRIELGA